ncbi:MAG: hypothetical protein SYNGOMJ08_00195 [Candidatus Syntrophoarchaeum sp. GoM_oil]|nr:MAG: hypothetical protein SYNGOMJ08_00195 [Candidatus Syntrophoarchaeum sp. GoM_oil]
MEKRICPKCGKDIWEGDKVCPYCGSGIGSKRRYKGVVLFVGIICMAYGILMLSYAMNSYIFAESGLDIGDITVSPTPSQVTHKPIPITPTATPILTQKEKNIQIVTEIVEDYYKTHTYNLSDRFVCADMAIDVWNMVETQGINAKIAVGNVNNPDVDWTEYDHAWVVAETSPGKWLALETTAGYVTDEDNYYKGYFFENPKEFKEYLERIKEYNA